MSRGPLGNWLGRTLGHWLGRNTDQPLLPQTPADRFDYGRQPPGRYLADPLMAKVGQRRNILRRR